MAYLTRINYTAQQKSEMWDRWQQCSYLNELLLVFNGHDPICLAQGIKDY